MIDRKGILRYAESGGFTREGLDQVLGPLIAESPDSLQADGGQSRSSGEQ